MKVFAPMYHEDLVQFVVVPPLLPVRKFFYWHPLTVLQAVLFFSIVGVKWQQNDTN